MPTVSIDRSVSVQDTAEVLRKGLVTAMRSPPTAMAPKKQGQAVGRRTRHCAPESRGHHDNVPRPRWRFSHLADDQRVWNREEGLRSHRGDIQVLNHRLSP
jgi:hypothetical protein